MDRDSAFSADEEADQALRDSRSRFIAGFSQRHGAMTALLTDFGTDANPAHLTSLREAAHKLAGLAGVLGFPSVSRHAAVLEDVLLQSTVELDGARAELSSIATAFAHDLAGNAPSWAHDAKRAPAGARILIVEDDEEQRRVAASGLRAAGYRVLTAGSGNEAVIVTRNDRPDLVLLDVDLPGLDGMAVCRQLKLDPALAAIPIVFCTARVSSIDRITGLTLGADDYITKPYAPSELLLRIRRQLSRTDEQTKVAAAAPTRALAYDLFVASAADMAARGPASIVLIRTGATDLERAADQLLDNLRRRDLVGRFSEGHLIAMLPGLSAPDARSMVRGIFDAITPPIDKVAIGATEMRSGQPLADAIADADYSLAQDRVSQGGTDSGKTTILIAEDDPDVLHIVDTRLRAAGYRTVIAVDGQQTVDALGTTSPAIVVLDLMMPKLTGFDVLVKLRQREQRPRTIVVSARGRDEDITRAFELGADDYVSKPFNPEELVARIARLTR